MFTLSGRPRLPDVRRRGQGRPADAAARRPPRADRGVRRRGDRQADPGPGPRRADRRAGRHQRRQRDRAGPVRRLADGRGRRPGARRTAGAAAASRSSTSRRSSRPVSKLARTLHTAGDVLGGMDEAFTVAALLAPRAGVRRRPDGRVLQLRLRRRPRRAGTAARRRARRRRDRRDRRAARPRRARPVLVLGTDVWADGAEEAALRLVEALGHPDHHQRHGPRRRPRRPPAAGHQGPRRGARQAPTWWSWSARRWTSGSATASSAARTGADAGRASCTSPTPPARCPAHAELAGSVVRRPDRRASTACTPAVEPAARRPDWSAWVDRAAGHRARPPPSATPRCSAPRPTRSTPPASTASWCRGWPTTRS